MRFSEFVDQATIAEPILPIFHVTQASNLARIISDGELKTSDCDVFGRYLLYTFYGFPAYRTKEFPPDGFVRDRLPCCFIFGSSEQGIEHVFPFDSGGFKKSFMHGDFPDAGNLDEYELRPNLQSCQRHVSAFFGSHVNYINGIAAHNDKVDPSHYKVRAYFDAIGQRTSDPRWYSSEISYNIGRKLSDNLLAIVVPNELIKSKVIIDFNSSNPHVLIIPYFSPYNSTYEAVYGRFSGRVWQFLTDKYGEE